MYSGTTLHHKSGNVLGVHQKINKVAHRIVLSRTKAIFPSLKMVLYFEGKNGPDGLKRKNPGADEPWHFIDPDDSNDRNLLDQILNHQKNLTKALAEKDEEKAAFEAAWLAHAVVDGLTPAHHFPLEEHLEEIRGEPKETRNSVRKKIVMPGEGSRQKLKNNWEFWGAKGIMTTHLLFELGVASAITPLRARKIDVTDKEYEKFKKLGIEQYFLNVLHEVTELHMYETFTHWGWTPTLARQTRTLLVPAIIKTVALAWLKAVEDAKN